eukprot:scpid29158/ scgid19877/ 
MQLTLTTTATCTCPSDSLHTVYRFSSFCFSLRTPISDACSLHAGNAEVLPLLFFSKNTCRVIISKPCSFHALCQPLGNPEIKIIIISSSSTVVQVPVPYSVDSAVLAEAELFEFH